VLICLNLSRPNTAMGRGLLFAPDRGPDGDAEDLRSLSKRAGVNSEPSGADISL
jgi:hypothetical protein